MAMAMAMAMEDTSSTQARSKLRSRRGSRVCLYVDSLIALRLGFAGINAHHQNTLQFTHTYMHVRPLLAKGPFLYPMKPS